MNDIRRSILWAVFFLSLFMLWEAWNKHTGQPGFLAPRPSAQASAPAAMGSASTPLPAPAGGAQASGGAGAPPSSVPMAAGELIEVRTDLYRATLDTRGASLVRLELLQHVDQDDRSRNVVLFDRRDQHTYTAQSGWLGAPGLPNHRTAFKLLSTQRELADTENELSLEFEAAGEAGVVARKRFVFKRGSYLIDVQHVLNNGSDQAVPTQLYLQLLHDGTVKGNTNMFAGPVAFTGPAFYTEADKFKKVEFTEIEKNKAVFPHSANNGWVAMVQHYFASAWLATGQEPREFFAQRVDNNLYAAGMVLPTGTLEPGASVNRQHQLFAGPQEEKRLETLAPGLELVKDYGMFAILAKPLFWLLDKIHSVVGNWGWAIVALVVLLKAAFFSLNASAYRSMAKMKTAAPRVQAARDRYKDQPQQLQQEMLKIYREEKVNPMGGCLPMLVQMPVFLALYWVLLSSVEMRNAPWVAWVADLSVPDPWYVLPAIMTLSTLLQTWLNPTPPDPVQAKMMWIMPLVFSVMFFFFPAGLVLYWVTNNLLSILQQYLINKKLGVVK